MTEQQRKEIEELKTWDEWDAYVKSNDINMKVRLNDPELGKAIHEKGFELAGDIVAPISAETQAWVDREKSKKYDPNRKGLRQLIMEHNKENGN